MRVRELIVVASALIITSGAAAAVFALLSGSAKIFSLAFVAIGLVGLCLGVPAYLLARFQQDVTIRTGAVMGFVVGAFFPAMFILSGAPDEASVDGVPTAINGSYTLAGWLQNLTFIIGFGLLGMAGGLFFWFLVRRLRQPSEFEPQSEISVARTVALAAIASGVLAAAFFVVPYATTDRSCHNVFRNGGDSIGPVARFKLLVGPDQWSAVEIEAIQFARENQWSVRSDVRTEKEFPWFQISLCREPGTLISLDRNPIEGGIEFSVFQPQGGNSWQPSFRMVHNRVDARWPGKIEFQNEVGAKTGTPEWVQRPKN